MKVAVFGSAFNPPHLGHADVIFNALKDYDLIILVPSYAHAFNKAMVGFSYRLNLLEVFIQMFPAKRVLISSVEEALKEINQPVYTFDVLSELSKQYPNAEKFNFIIGPDNEKGWDKFHKAKEIKLNWGVKVYPENKSVRSSKIRALLSNKEFNEQMLAGLVPVNLINEISTNKTKWLALTEQGKV